MAATKGNCYICGKTVSKTAIKNHLLKEHGAGDEKCLLIKAEGAYRKGYWLYFAVTPDTELSSIDTFLRDIWCECCGHMSAFRWGREELDETTELRAFSLGSTFTYEYDFGSTTEILMTIVDTISRPWQKDDVELLARNEPPHRVCDECGSVATQIDALEGGALCDECAEKIDEEGYLLPIANSPRCGVCAYMGDEDGKWTFNAAKFAGQAV